MTSKTIKILSLIILFTLSSCAATQRINYVKTNSIDTIYINKYKKDSIYLKDSIYVKNIGDTIFIDRWHTKYISNIQLDTIYKSSNDTIIKYEQKIIEKRYVPAVYKWALGILICIIIGIVGYSAVKIYMKFKL